MIKNILFDFDGVILDSMKIKGDGFVELFKEYPANAVQKLQKYHYANGGISRFEKIRYFFNSILHEPISDQNIEDLAERFAQIISEKLFDRNNLIDETITFIQQNHIRYNCHIVSGAEHQELNALCNHFGIAHYFKSINGSPTPKFELVRSLLQTYHYQHDETILIGDSINDFEAAEKNQIRFYGYNNTQLQTLKTYLKSFQKFPYEL
jgi:phosphoglycolate phosphatase-like HAD superfamily hydrolase